MLAIIGRFRRHGELRFLLLALTDFSKGSKRHNFVSIGSMHNVYMEWMGSPFTHADVE